MQTIQYNGLSIRQAKKDIKHSMKDQPKTFFSADHTLFKYSRKLYLHTNDLVKSVVPDVVSEGSKILTVASSGDYILESVLNGAKEITSFDINGLQYYISCLKVWAIQVLDYDEYLNFFHNPCSFDYMSPTIIDKVIQHFADEPAFIFWDTFKKYRILEIETSKDKRYQVSEEQWIQEFKKWKSMTSQNKDIGDDIEAFIQYRICTLYGPHTQSKKFNCLNLLNYRTISPKLCLFSSNEKNYCLTKENLKYTKLLFIKSDLLELNENTSEVNFDGGLLSNIPFYMKQEDLEISIDRLLPLIKEDGLVSYYYHNMPKWSFEEYSAGNGFPICDQRFYRDGKFYEKYATALQTYGLLVNNGLDISLNEVPSQLSSEERYDTDVKCLIKKR